jgi:type VI secretion system protein ImpC
MIELDVTAKRKPTEVSSETQTLYLVLGDFGARRGQPVSIDRDNLDHVLARQEVTIAGSPLRELEDFHPDRLYQRLDAFRDLREKIPAEPEPSRPRAEPQANLGEIIRPASLLEQIVEGGDPFQQYLRDLTRAHAASPKSRDTQRIAAIGESMRALLHHPRFQTLEAAWRGLDFVVRQAEDDAARIHFAQFSRGDLERDLADASDLKSTQIYALLHSRPWRGIFGLYSFGDSGADIDLLGRIALLAASARAPFVAEGSADMGPHWDELRGIPEAKYLGLALPRFLLRLPYGAKSSTIESFEFEEMPATPVHSHYLWGHPALACLALLVSGPAEEGDELDLNRIPVHNFKEDGEWKMTPCAEVWLTGSQVQALIDLGLMPLISFRDSDRVRLAGFRAINSAALPLGR